MFINIIIVINILTTIVYCFIKDFNNDVYFIYLAKIYNKIIIKIIIIAKLFYNKNNEDNEDVIIFTSYFYIKFIALFKYLTLYYISNFDL